jgi:hypothetical protein
MLSSFFNKSARKGPTPFKYSIGEDNIVEKLLISLNSVHTNIGYNVFIMHQSTKFILRRNQLKSHSDNNFKLMIF